MKHAQALRGESRLGSFEEVARRWIDTKRHEWTKGYCHAVFLRIQMHVFPVSGYRPLKDISPKMMLEAFRKVQACCHLDTAHRMREISSQVFRFAISEGLDLQDPCADISDALKSQSSVTALQCLLHAAPVERSTCRVRALQSTQSIGKHQLGVSVRGPKAALHRKLGCGQGNPPITVTFGVANMFALADCINVGDLQGQAFAQTQSHAVEREEKHSATQHPSGGKLRLRLFHGDDVRQMLNLGGLMKLGLLQGKPSKCKVKNLKP